MRHEHDPDESTREELRAQIRLERQTRRLRTLNPRDPDYCGDPEDFPDYNPED